MKRKKILIFFAVTLLFAGCIKNKIDNSKSIGTCFLWEMKGEKSTIYLFGSVHCARKELYPLKNIIEDAYNSSDTLVVEADVLKTDSAMIQTLVMQKGIYTDGTTVDAHLPDNLKKEVDRVFTELSLPAQLKVYKPWLLSITILQMCLQKLGYNLELGLDIYFLKKASAEGKKIVELEGIEYQLNLFSGLSEKEQEALLAGSISDMNTYSELLEGLFTAWKKGDTKELSNILFKSDELNAEYQAFLDKLLNERNIEMADKIEKMFKEGGTYFVIIGAGHLIGKDSIIDRLKKKGYTIYQR